MHVDTQPERCYRYKTMLTKTHIQTLSRMPSKRNRVAKAIELGGVTQTAIAQDLGLTQTYISDVVRERFKTITLENAYVFSTYFGCGVEVLFPPECRHARRKEQPSPSSISYS
jgi:predicted XRE-type DNA-binding protein